MFLATGTAAGARWALTDRRGGVSRGRYDALNLGDHVGDDPDLVRHNRDLAAAELDLAGADLRFMRQVHGSTVAVVGRDTPAGHVPEADALVTADRGVGLAVLAADCVPVLLSARRADVIAVAHAGRKGVVAGVVPAAVAAMARLGARPRRIVAIVGAAVCGACYEVPARTQDEVAAAVPATRSTTRAGTPGLDLRAGVVAQLLAAGVETVEVLPWCTAEHADLYSHRRDGVTGRLAGLVHLPA